MLNNAALLMAGKKTVKGAQVVCSGDTTWYVTNTGELYGCGNGEFGQQGNGSSGRGANVTTFTKRADNVDQVACSDTTTWFLTKSGELYGCGDGYYGQQGNDSTAKVNTFTKRADNVAQIACSDNTTWYVTKSGELYGCGNGDSGQQGDGSNGCRAPEVNDYHSVTTFTKRADNVAQFACSGDTTWYLTKTSELYGCGYGYYGQQGNGSTNNVTRFTKRF